MGDLSGETVDLLLVDEMEEHAEGLKQAFEKRGIGVKNTGIVTSKLHPEGNLSEGEVTPGSNTFRVGNVAKGEYTFSGDELNNNNILVIVCNAVRYGRKFNQICTVLDEFKGRNFLQEAIPPTFAYFKSTYDEWDGREVGINRIERVSKIISRKYVVLFEEGKPTVW